MSVSKSIWSRYANQFGKARATRPLRMCMPHDTAAEVLEGRSLLTAGWVTSTSRPSNDIVSDLTGDAAGDTYVTGLFSRQQSMFGSNALTGNGLGDIFVARQHANGQYLWAAEAGNPSSGNDKGLDVATDATGDVFITGYFEGTAKFGTPAKVRLGHCSIKTLPSAREHPENLQTYNEN